MRKLMVGLWAAVAATALSMPAAWAEEEKVPLDELPKPVTAAVKAKFPDAELKSAEKEEVDGKTIYEVSLKSKGHDYDVSLTPEGRIIEIEKVIAAKDLPAAVTKALDQKYPKATIKLAEEISKDNKTNYEVVIETADKKKLEVVLDPTGKILKEEAKGKEEGPSEGEESIPLDKLSKVVVDAVKAKFPGAELQSAAKEDEDGTLVYEVVIKHKGSTIEVILSLDGKIMATEKEIEPKDLPAKVGKALGEKYPKATIKKTEELTKDDKISYEVIIETADKKQLEVVFDPDGKVLEEEAKGKEEEPSEGEESIPLDKLSKVVVDAVKAKFPGAELQSAAKEDEDGTLVYEVVIKHKGSTIEVILSLAGKIMATEKEIEAKDLPAKVGKALEEKYPKAKIKKTEELTKDDKISYEVIIETADKKQLEVVFDPDGKVLEEEAKEENEK